MKIISIQTEDLGQGKSQQHKQYLKFPYPHHLYPMPYAPYPMPNGYNESYPEKLTPIMSHERLN